jgi:hypothetical protein
MQATTYGSPPTAARAHRARLLRDGRLLIVLAAALAAQGCVVGQVLDARNGNPVAATVETYAACEGDGCTVSGNGWQRVETDAEGNFLYDGYGRSKPQARLTLITGRDTFEIRISAPGFATRTVNHRPKLQTHVDAETGESFQYTALPHIVYLCPEGEPDSDSDDLCDAAEARYQTAANKEDTDDDSLSDRLELFGTDNLDLAYDGANPRHRDVFVELDFYQWTDASGQPRTRQPPEAALEKVKTAYRTAPVANPDGVSGIELHVLVDSAIDPNATGIDVDFNLSSPTLFGGWLELDEVKQAFQPEHRQPFYHYALYAERFDGATGFGISRWIPGHDFVVAGEQPDEDEHAATFMHELGHNMGLWHGGFELMNYKPNYFSVMNYLYIDGVTRNGKRSLDYSRIAVAGISESAVNEELAFEPLVPSDETRALLNEYDRVRLCTSMVAEDGFDVGFRCVSTTVLDGTAENDLDFNRNGMIDPGTMMTSLDGSDVVPFWPLSTCWWDYCGTLDDWNTLRYKGEPFLGGGTIGDVDLGAFEEPTETEPNRKGCPFPSDL